MCLITSAVQQRAFVHCSGLRCCWQGCFGLRSCYVCQEEETCTCEVLAKVETMKMGTAKRSWVALMIVILHGTLPQPLAHSILNCIMQNAMLFYLEQNLQRPVCIFGQLLHKQSCVFAVSFLVPELLKIKKISTGTKAFAVHQSLLQGWSLHLEIVSTLLSPLLV